MSDTLSTLYLGSLLSNKAPEVFKSSLLLRNKVAVKPHLDNNPIVCWMEAWRVAKIYCGTSLGEGVFPGWFLMYDLRKNPEEIMKCIKRHRSIRKSTGRFTKMASKG